MNLLSVVVIVAFLLGDAAGSINGSEDTKQRRKLPVGGYGQMAKVSKDYRQVELEKRYAHVKEMLAEKGIDADEIFRRGENEFDISKEWHPREHRLLDDTAIDKEPTAPLDSGLQAERILMKDDSAFWSSFLQTEIMSIVTVEPTSAPRQPTVSPTTEVPSGHPSVFPSSSPSEKPSGSPSLVPTDVPSVIPSEAPTTGPSHSPSEYPSISPSVAPSKVPSTEPSSRPSLVPSETPSTSPSTDPSSKPSEVPTPAPSAFPSVMPSPTPSAMFPAIPMPTHEPSRVPSPISPSSPSPITFDPPTLSPTFQIPSALPTPTIPPLPTGSPVSLTDAPFQIPTRFPTKSPTLATTPPVIISSDAPATLPMALPTNSPIEQPSFSIPTRRPSNVPSQFPSSSPMSPTPGPTDISRARRVVLPVALFGGSEFEDPESYQSKALNWLETSNLGPFSDGQVIQRYALACIYFATNRVITAFTNATLGPGIILPWTSENGWLTDASECMWQHLACNSNGFITDIDLADNLVTGEFPPEVVLVKSTLQLLSLSDNLVFTRGNLFNSYMGELTQLTRLEYANTNFINENGVPTEIGRLKNLNFYSCNQVRYAGALSSLAFPSDMTQLTYIDIELNSFNSPIPTEVGLLPNLRFFYARNSDITGDLEFMRTASNLRECWTDGNPELRGTLPTFLGSLSELASFSVTNCNWSGQMPTELGLLSNVMIQMFLYGNTFSGTVPQEWGQLSALRSLEIERNSIGGMIPNEVCSLRTTRSLISLTADCINCPVDGSPCCHACVDSSGNLVPL